MTVDRKAARRAFKERRTAAGVYAVRCAVSGETWVGVSRDLDSATRGIVFLLGNGMHHNKKMLAAWQAHGAGAFEFSVVETFGEDLLPVTLNDLLRDRRKYWQLQLSAAPI